MLNQRRHQLLNRQDVDTDIPTLGSIAGAATITPGGAATGSLILASDGPAATGPPVAAPNFAPGTSLVLTSTNSVQTITSTPSPSSSASGDASAALQHSSISMTTVIAACVGAFAGLGLVVLVFLWWIKRPPQNKSRSRGLSNPSANRNAQGEDDKRRQRGRSWNKLGEEGDMWEGRKPNGGSERSPSQKEIDEKIFPMFKKTNSVRTTRTAKALEEHGFDLPPFEFSKYHPSLAEELSLEEPTKPFTQRGESGISWDGETVMDDSFLSLRSVRMDSGTMSPTPNIAKITPPAVAEVHRWESAEVVTVDGDSRHNQNPFHDEAEERPRTATNPFFNASEMHRPGNRSRSNSRTSRHSRSVSHTSRTSRANSMAQSQFTIEPPESLPQLALPQFKTHAPNDSIASGSSGGLFPSEHAMRSLIAALELSQEEVEARLRVASMQPSTPGSRYSVSSSHIIDEDDISTIRGFPFPPGAH